MKFTLAALTLLASALTAQAAYYTVVFSDPKVPGACLEHNTGYLKKVSIRQVAKGKKLKLTTVTDCDPVIFDEISYVCGNVVSTDCQNA